MKIVSILAIIFGFSQCGSLKLEEKSPINITSATYNNWVGGMPGISGTNVRISYTKKSNVVFDSIYFQNRITKIQLREERGKSLIMGYFKNENSNEKRDFNLNSTVQKEMSNIPPKLHKMPFELKENEAVISYFIDDKLKYYKIESLKKTKSIFYPSAPKQK